MSFGFTVVYKYWALVFGITTVYYSIDLFDEADVRPPKPVMTATGIGSMLESPWVSDTIHSYIQQLNSYRAFPLHPINKDNNNRLKTMSKKISVQGLAGPPHNLQLGGGQAVRRLRNSCRLTLHPYPVTPPIERYLPMLRELEFLSANDNDKAKKKGGGRGNTDSKRKEHDDDSEPSSSI